MEKIEYVLQIKSDIKWRDVYTTSYSIDEQKTRFIHRYLANLRTNSPSLQYRLITRQTVTNEEVIDE